MLLKVVTDCPVDVDDDGICDPHAGNNHPPLAAGDSYTVEQGRTVLLTVLGNDSDEDGDALAVEVEGDATLGTATSAAGGVSYLSAELGDGTFQYRLSDGTALSNPATVLLKVVTNCPVDVDDDGICDPHAGNNHPPLAAGDSYTVEQGRTVLLTVLGNDSDEDGDALAVEVEGDATLGTATSAVGGVSYVSTELGDGTFQYHVSDGTALSNTATVLMKVVTECPADQNDDGICEPPPPICQASGGDTDGDGICDASDACPLDPQNQCADVVVLVSNGQSSLVTQAATIYDATVVNIGNVAASTRIRSQMTPGLADAVWTCETPSAACPQAAGTGDIDMTLVLSPMQELHFSLMTTVTAANGSNVGVTLSADVTGVTDADLLNNTASDVDTVGPIGLFRDGFEQRN